MLSSLLHFSFTGKPKYVAIVKHIAIIDSHSYATKLRRIQFRENNMQEKSFPIKQQVKKTAESPMQDETNRLEFTNKGVDEMSSLGEFNDRDEIEGSSEVNIKVNPLALVCEENDSAL